MHKGPNYPSAGWNATQRTRLDMVATHGVGPSLVSVTIKIHSPHTLWNTRYVDLQNRNGRYSGELGARRRAPGKPRLS